MCVVAHVLCVCRYHSTRAFHYLVWAAVFASCAALTRYIGYSLLAVFFVYAVIALFTSLPHKVGRILVALAAFMPSVAYAVRNYLISGYAHGRRTPALVGLWHNVSLTATTLIDDLGIMLIPIILALVWALWRLFRRRTERADIAVRYIALVTGAYVALLLYSTSTVRIDPISARYFAPLYPLLVVLMFALIGLLRRSATSAEQTPSPRLLRYFVPVAVTVVALIGTAAQRSDLNELLWSFEKRTDANGSHLAAGFNQTRTCADLRHFLRYKASVTEDGVNCVVLSDAARSRCGRAMFLRRSMFPLRATNFEPTLTAVGSGGDVSWRWVEEGRSAEARLFDHDEFRTAEELGDALTELFERTGVEQFFLIYENSKANRRIFGDEGLDPATVTGIALRQPQTIGHYTVYDCRPR